MDGLEDLKNLKVTETKAHIDGPIVESKNQRPGDVMAMLKEARRNASGASTAEQEFNATYDDFRHLDKDEQEMLKMLEMMKKQQNPYYLEDDKEETSKPMKTKYVAPQVDIEIKESKPEPVVEETKVKLSEEVSPVETIKDITETNEKTNFIATTEVSADEDNDWKIATMEEDDEELYQGDAIIIEDEERTNEKFDDSELALSDNDVTKINELSNSIDEQYNNNISNELEYEALLKKQAMAEVASAKPIKTKKEEKIMEEKKEPIVSSTIENDDAFITTEVENNNLDEITEELPDISEVAQPENNNVHEKKVAKRISLNDLQVVNINELDTNKDIESLISLPTYQVTAIKSGYSCNIAPLVNADVVSILAETSDQYNQTDKIYKVLFNKIKKFSFDTKIDYQTWTKITAIDDLETLFYGLYCSTYRGISELSVTCNNCNNTSTHKIANTTMIHLTNKEKYKELMDRINREATNFSKVKDFSEISRSETILLDDSRVAVTLKTPTLFDMLTALRYISDDIIKSDESLMNEILYTKEMYIPSKTAGNGKYITVREPADIARIINNLNINDSNLLADTISDIVNSNTISYSIDKLKCPSCGKEMESAPVSMGDLLFTRIFERL